MVAVFAVVVTTEARLRDVDGQLIEAVRSINATPAQINVARALAVAPKILLLDEPFAALDAQTREIMQIELLSIWQASPKTVLLITHQIDRAVFLPDTVEVFSSRRGKCGSGSKFRCPCRVRSNLSASQNSPSYSNAYGKDPNQKCGSLCR